MLNGSRRIHAHSRATSATLAAAALLLLALVVTISPASAEPGNDNRAPELPPGCEALQVEAGHKVAFQTYAEGVQIYRWNGTGWDFVGPEAILYSLNGEGVVGIHYAGPTWESNSGSKVVGAVLERATPDPDSIPWLKLKAASTQGSGPFEKVTFIQRVNTVGGKAPAEPGDFVGEEARVPYTTEYYFYRKQGK